MLTDEEYVVAALRIPKGKGDGAVAPSLGGTEAVLGGGGGAATSSAAAVGCDAPTSTHVGVARLHACLLRALARAPPVLGWWSRSVGVSPGREELHVVSVAGCDEVEAIEPEHRACREQAWPVCHLGNKRE